MTNKILKLQYNRLSGFKTKVSTVPETFEWILPELAVINFTQQFNTLVENL